MINVNANSNPCRHCMPPKRSAACHSDCPEYLAWKAAAKESKAKYEDNKGIERALDGIEKERRKRHRYKRRK